MLVDTGAMTTSSNADTNRSGDAARRLRRAVVALGTTAVGSTAAIVLMADAAHARIAVNHSETAGRDG